MARKPIHLQAAGKLTPRDRVWAAIRALQRDGKSPFTYDQVADRCVKDAPADAVRKRIEERTIDTYICCLVAGGFLKRNKPDERYEACTFELIRDVGIHAPRLTKDGKPVEQGQANACLWLGMRRLKRFDYRDLIVAASVKVEPQTAKAYCRMLRIAGYLAVDVPSKPGTPEKYRFVRDTGPKAPMIQRVRHVYDPNLGRVMWHPEVDS